MRTKISRAFCMLSFWLLLRGAAAAQNANACIFVPDFRVLAEQTRQTVTFSGTVKNHCGTKLGSQTSFRITYNERRYEIPLGGLANGGVLPFTRTVPVRPGLETRLVLEVITPGRQPHHYHHVSPVTGQPCTVKPCTVKP
jgi:hypothetical protein